MGGITRGPRGGGPAPKPAPTAVTHSSGPGAQAERVSQLSLVGSTAPLCFCTVSVLGFRAGGCVPEVIKTTHLQEHVAGSLAGAGRHRQTVSHHRGLPPLRHSRRRGGESARTSTRDGSAVTPKVTQNEDGNDWKGYFLFLF